MASRFDQPNEPDLDRYETRTDEIDVPDFDYCPNSQASCADPHCVKHRGSLAIPLPPDQPVDPAEHAAHAIIDAMGTLRAEVLKADTVARAINVKGMIKRQYDQMNALDLLASAKIDDLVERRR